MGAGLCKDYKGEVLVFDDMVMESPKPMETPKPPKGRKVSVAVSELLDNDSFLNASEAVFGNPLSASQNLIPSPHESFAISTSVAQQLKDLNVGQVCAMLDHIETLLQLNTTELCPECIPSDDARYPAAQYFIKVGLTQERMNVSELSKALTERKTNECNKVKPEWHEECNTAWEGLYKNQHCMHCEAMLAKERDWIPHWAVPPGPPAENIMDPSLGSSISSYSTCASGVSTSSVIATTAQRKCDENHLFLEYLTKTPEVQLLTSAVSPDTLVVSKYTKAPVPITKKLCRELAILKTIIHPNISPLLACIYENSSIIVFTMFVPGGQLYRLFDPPFKMDTVRLHSMSLLLGLHYLHVLNITHGNIKPSNVLVDGNGRAVLCDVGTLHGWKKEDFYGFLSPSEQRTAAGDVWSLGVLIFFMAVGRPPFPGDTASLVRKYLTKSDPDFKSIPCMILRDLMRGMLEKRDAKRMLVRECLEHPFFNDLMTGIPEYTHVMITAEDIAKSLVNNPLEMGSCYKMVSRKFPGRRLAAEEDSNRTSTSNLLKAAMDNRELTLNLSCLSLRAVPASTFEFFWVKKLDLSMNYLTDIPPEIEKLHALEELIMKGNELARVPVEVLALQSLTSLNLSGNMIGDLPDIPKGSVLEEVDFDNNRFAMVSTTLTNVEGLKRLSFSGNPILHLPGMWRWVECKLKINNSPVLMKELNMMDLPMGLEIEWNMIYPDRVGKFLYLGSLRSVQEYYVLSELNIQHIMTIGKDLAVIDPMPEGIEHTRVNVDSSTDTQINEFFDDATCCLDRVLASQKAVIVHCLSGNNRSVAILCAYLIRYSGFSFRQAMAHIKSARPTANPNQGFQRQLMGYEKMMHGV